MFLNDYSGQEGSLEDVLDTTLAPSMVQEETSTEQSENDLTEDSEESFDLDFQLLPRKQTLPF